MLAQENTTGIASVFLWSGVLIGIVILAFLAYAQFKRWMKEPEVSSTSTGFTLSDLREMHRQGKMTDAEYQAARAKMVAKAKQTADALPDPLAGRRKPPTNLAQPAPPTQGPLDT